MTFYAVFGKAAQATRVARHNHRRNIPQADIWAAVVGHEPIAADYVRFQVQRADTSNVDLRIGRGRVVGLGSNGEPGGLYL